MIFSYGGIEEKNCLIYLKLPSNESSHDDSLKEIIVVWLIGRWNDMGMEGLADQKMQKLVDGKDELLGSKAFPKIRCIPIFS